MAKKKKGLTFFVVFLVLFVVIFIMFFGGYLYFETNRLSLYGVKPFSDLKSYTASIIKRVPLLGKSVKYTSLRVMPYQKLLETRLNAFQKVLDTRAASLNAKEIKIEEKEKNLKALQNALALSQSKIQSEIKKFKQEQETYQSYQHRIKTLDQWISNSDPTKMGKILANSKIPITVLVDALMNLSPNIAGTLLQSIAQSNATLAASIVNTLAGVKK